MVRTFSISRPLEYIDEALNAGLWIFINIGFKRLAQVDAFEVLKLLSEPNSYYIMLNQNCF